MPTHKYTPSELLQLKEGLPDRPDLEFKPGAVDLIKPQPSAAPVRSRRLKKSKEEFSSSTDSEEHIVFKGKKQMPGPNGIELKWGYRGRTESEVTSEEPRSAPAGLAAQQSEGFQRFFKAVVSPTHVRVTAGGRIVPNTRASASPTPKWERDPPSPDNNATETVQEKPQDVQKSAAQAAPVFSPIFPGHPAFFQHMGMPMPLYPMPAGLPWPYPMQAPPTLSLNSQRGQHEEQQATDSASTIDRSAAKTEKHRPEPIRIMPPEQFDHSRPFFYNGQVVYPSSASGTLRTPMPVFPSPYLSPGMFGAHAYPPGRVASMGSVSQPSPMPTASGVTGHTPTAHQAIGNAASTSQSDQPSSGLPQSLVSPPVTSIRPSTITKRQLDSLRSSLKYYEDQLQYNKHQIDEQSIAAQTGTIKKQIEQFEHNYKMQLQFESNYYPRAGPTSGAPAGNSVQKCSTPSRPCSVKDETRSEDVSQVGSVRSASQTPSIRQFQSTDQGQVRAPRERNRAAVGINSSKSSANSSAALDALEAHILRQRETQDPTKKPHLPTGAALAAPFHPGSAPILSNTSDTQAGFHNSYAIGYGRTLGGGSQVQDRSSVTNQSTGSIYAAQPATADPRLMPDTFGHEIGSAPYLVGRLPQGTDPYNARSADYVYARDLTDEEKRARHAYWGQIATKGTGLPKFDGKDFYPPSPTKRDDNSAGSKPRQIPIGQAESDSSTTFLTPSVDRDPFCSIRKGTSFSSADGGRKFSKAIPIVAPNEANNRNAKPSASTHETDQALSPKPVSVSKDDGKQTSSGQKGDERSSTKSGHDLWQTMLKKGSASGSALPSAVSSTTATGYLPHYFGHAAASLSPAISNAGVSPTRAVTQNNDKFAELDNGGVRLTTEKTGENCPPGDMRSSESEVLRDLQDRMLRDAERRGVIGSAWQ